jgi:hypothetical protein
MNNNNNNMDLGSFIFNVYGHILIGLLVFPPILWVLLGLE